MEPHDTGLMLDWDTAAAALAAVDPWVSPAELQGLLCGAVCGKGAAPGDDGWLDLLNIHTGEDLAAVASGEVLIEFRNQVLDALGDEALGFSLLLPDDETPLEARLRNLGLWCGGFLSGFGLTGGNTDGLDEDAVDLLEDLAAIAEVDAETEEGEGAEGQFAEVCEYVRIGALLMLSSVHARAVDSLMDRLPETDA